MPLRGANNVELFDQFQLQLDRGARRWQYPGADHQQLFCGARGRRDPRRSRCAGCAHWLLAAIAWAACSSDRQGSRVSHHFALRDQSLSTNTFYMFYLSLTFFHFMHVVMGMVILAAVAYKAGAAATARRHMPAWKPGPLLAHGRSGMADPVSPGLCDAVNGHERIDMVFAPAPAIWLMLVGLTLITYGVGLAGLTGDGLWRWRVGRRLVKGHLVADYFMGLREGGRLAADRRCWFWVWDLAGCLTGDVEN
jgi:hypothetical protein